MASKQSKSNSPSGSYHPRILKKADQYPWLVLAGIIIAGAMLGFLLSVFMQPVYEAEALVTTNLELVQTEIITEIMVDAQLNQVGTLVFHPDVVAGVIASEQANGNTLTLEDLKEIGTVERQMMSTIIKVRDANPQVAARIASAWAEILYHRLNEAYPYALRVSDAKMQLYLLSTCAASDSAEPNLICAGLTSASLAEMVADLEGTILEESPRTLGLTSAVNISQFQPAAVPAKPQNFLRGSLILAGALLGLVSGLVLLEAQPDKKRK